MVILCLITYIFIHQSNTVSLIESMIVLRPRHRNLRQVFRLFSLVRGFASHHPFLYISTARNEVAIISAQEYKKSKIATPQSDCKKIEPLYLPTL